MTNCTNIKEKKKKRKLFKVCSRIRYYRVTGWRFRTLFKRHTFLLCPFYPRVCTVKRNVSWSRYNTEIASMRGRRRRLEGEGVREKMARWDGAPKRTLQSLREKALRWLNIKVLGHANFPQQLPWVFWKTYSVYTQYIEPFFSLWQNCSLKLKVLCLASPRCWQLKLPQCDVYANKLRMLMLSLYWHPIYRVRHWSWNGLNSTVLWK